MAARTLRSALSASSRFSNTLRCSNTVGFWNLRPMPTCTISFSRRRSRSIVEPKKALPASGRVLPVMHVHHRRLAGAVGADDAAQLADVDRQGERVQRLEAVEADGDVVEVQRHALREIGGPLLQQLRAGSHAATGCRLLGLAFQQRTTRARAGLHQFGRHAGSPLPLPRSFLTSPTMPCGRNSVTAMNSAPRK